MTATPKTQYLNTPSEQSQPSILGPPVPNTLSLDEFYSIFPDEISAERWFEDLRWSNGITCHRCGDNRFTETKSESRSAVVPYWCYTCRKRFSVRTGTRLQGTNLPLKKWALSIYLSVNGPISSTGLSGYLGTEAHTAWSALQNIRQAWGDPEPLHATVAEIDETPFGKVRGASGQIIVLGMKDRNTGKIAAKVIPKKDLATIEPFVQLHMQDNQGTLYSDGAKVYRAVRCVADHQYVVHSKGQYVNGKVHTNGIDSFWSSLKEAYLHTYRQNISAKYFPLYVNEIVGRHNIQDKDTMGKMKWLASRLLEPK